jgi:hypothetical protein
MRGVRDLARYRQARHFGEANPLVQAAGPRVALEILQADFPAAGGQRERVRETYELPPEALAAYGGKGGERIDVPAAGGPLLQQRERAHEFRNAVRVECRRRDDESEKHCDHFVIPFDDMRIAVGKVTLVPCAARRAPYSQAVRPWSLRPHRYRGSPSPASLSRKARAGASSRRAGRTW